MDSNPLVTVRISAYNSSKYILETLDSIYKQTYKNIELIISDDCSIDSTVEICEKWIETHKERFARTKIITSSINTGIPANINRAIKEAKGEWIKGIAADDLLVKNCIELLVKYINLNKDACIVGGNVLKFYNTSEDRFEEDTLVRTNREKLALLSVEEQYKRVLYKYYLSTPTLFISSKVYDDILYDESFPLYEDYPFFLSSLKRGYKYNHINENLVCYRIHDNSVYNNNLNQKIFNDFYKKRFPFDKKYRLPYWTLFERIKYTTLYYAKCIFDNKYLNRRKGVIFYLYKKLFL